MLGVDTSIDDVDIDARATIGLILVLGESAERELGTVAYAGKTLREQLISNQSISHAQSEISRGC